jgi:hypothetical protein
VIGTASSRLFKVLFAKLVGQCIEDQCIEVYTGSLIHSC